MDDDFCDLTLPEDYQSTDTSQTENRISPYGFDSPIPSSRLWDMRLAILKSKVLKSLYSPTAFQKQDAYLLQTIRELDDELEKWRMSVDLAQRPTLGSLGDRACLVDQAIDLHTRMQRNVARFEFHYLLASIHRASGRCSSWMSGGTEDLTGISSSISIAVQASRMTIHHLCAVVDVVSEEAFW
ncbi:hypothetical protein ColLi_00342 [Colletotrichum liriopes]|uniref:Uncharacterized protein n=1 Tax=Colletotrichum liriopes TaxID=708192 RepID=A0AA37GAV7_9PEZI|nr:hypothetical protein ColLi_00342 [Colletotrichum liriopes]